MHGKLIMPEASLHKDNWHTVKDVNPFYIYFFKYDLFINL